MPTLPDATITAFRDHAFNPSQPVLLPRGHYHSLPAIQKWFTSTKVQDGSTLSSLDRIYLDAFGETPVPLEFSDSAKFQQRTLAPLSIFLEWTSIVKPTDRSRFYLAQAPLFDLPPPLQNDLPTPEMVLRAGRGDVYDANLWMGIPPTCTPLHRDPNPNLFVQLAGSKVARLLDPGAGDRVFERVQKLLGSGTSKVFRGNEMMQGAERELLKNEVWGDESQGGYEVLLTRGDGLFIPTGWWHSIRGVGERLTGSANWWFR